MVRDVGEMIGNEDEVILSSGRKCWCGLIIRRRISYRLCFLNKIEVVLFYVIFIVFMYGKLKRDEW